MEEKVPVRKNVLLKQKTAESNVCLSKDLSPGMSRLVCFWEKIMS